jgi:methionyl-tRNA formyltransferase
MDDMVNQQGILKIRVLLLGKRDSQDCLHILERCRKFFEEVTYFDGQWGDPLPTSALMWQGDLIISYLCRWVIPAELLERAKIAAINFHPGTPEYPGIGCNNFALYEGAATYGATCHHMATRVDVGQVIAVERFSIADTETVASLLQRTYHSMLNLFETVMDKFCERMEFSESEEHWTRPPFTRMQFNALCCIDSSMSDSEVKNRVRATFYPPWGPHLELHGFRFKLDLEHKS